MDEQHLAVAVAAARAGAVELMSRRDDRVVREKAPKDLVTDADLASQAAIRETLDQAFPRYAFVGEEEGENEPPDSVKAAAPDAPPCWIVDPLDGTVNYVHRLQSFAVSIGLYAAGKMRLGVILDPVTGELFTAIDGCGAHVNDRRMQASDCTDLSQGLIACSFPAGVRGDAPEVGRFVRVLEKCRSLRRLGSCALNMCYVADGRLDAYWATSVSSWDAAAGIVIAREAGATITAYDGSAIDDWHPRFLVSSTTEIHRPIIELLIDSVADKKERRPVQLDVQQMHVRDIYQWMVGLITPRPIAWISTVSPGGSANLAPFSFFNGVGANPPLIMFCPANRRDGTPKDTLANIQRTGEFVVNVVTEPMAEAMNLTSVECDVGVDEFELSSLAKAASVQVTPPRVQGCAAALECRLHQAIQLGTGPSGANLVIGRIVWMHVDDGLLDESGKLAGQRLNTIGRLGGSGYTKTTERFDLARPRWPQ